MKKAPLVIAAFFVLAVVICLISATTLFAGLTANQKLELQRCAYRYNQCLQGCAAPNSSSQCKQSCLNQYYDCRQKAHIPDYVPGGPLTGQNSLPSKSNPTATATPRKGPDKIGTSGISHSSPTPTSSPRSTPKKNQH